jgi:hypothetical protein
MSCITAIEKPKIVSPIDTMLLLLNEGPIAGFTRLDKMLFLVRQDKLLKSLPQYEFEHGNFGPYSIDALDDLMALKILKGVTTKNLSNPRNRLESVDEEFIEKELDDEANWQNYPLEVFTLSDKVQTHVNLMRENLTCEQKKALTVLYLLWVHKPLSLIFNYIYSVYYKKPISVDSVIYSATKKKRNWRFWKRSPVIGRLVKEGEEK